MKYIFLLLFCLPCWAFAQIQVTIPEPEWQEINNRINSLENESESLRNTIVSLKDTISARDSVIFSLNKDLEINKSKTHVTDSINKELKSKVENIQTIQAFAQKQIQYADTCILKYANAQLYFKYDEKRVKNALSALYHISNTDMKEKQTFENLLKEYYRYYTEIKILVNNAQDNPNRTNPFNGQQYLSALKTSIENSSYYRSHYNKGMGIPFLNDVIRILLMQLSKAKPGDGIYADFSQVIETLK